MRSAAEIWKQLTDLAVVKAKAEAYGEPDFASKLALESIRAQEAELLKELRTAERQELDQVEEVQKGWWA